MPFSSNPNAVLGRPLDRRDARLKVTGAARYAADQPQKNLAYGALVTSSVPSGRVAALDASLALKAPGVLYVLSHDNATTLKSTPQGTVTPPGGRAVTLLQSDEVLYHGQPIAVVVADTLEHAKAGAELVRVRYTTTTAALDFDAAKLTAYKPPVFAKGGADTSSGDVDAAWQKASLKVDASYSTPMEHHNPMEPHATTASWDGDMLTLYDSTQSISGSRKSVATALGIDPKNVHVVCPFVGGGFGCKGSTWSHVMLAAMASRAVRRPVKLVLERPQMWGPIGGRPQTEQRIALASSADGKLLATRHDVISHTSTFEDFPETSAVVTRMMYASDTRATTHRMVKLNVGTPTYMRAPGEASGTFALESAIDEMAERAAVDPLAFRLRNYAEQSPDGLPWSSKALRDCYLIGADRFGWSKRTMRPGTVRDGHELVGYGMGSATYPTNRSKATARALVGHDGIAVVQSGTQDLGTGTWTVMAQVAAETLGFPFDKVRFELGDSDLPEAPGSGGSQSVASVSPAVQAACVEARAQLIQIAITDPKGPLANAAVADVTIENGWFRSIAQPERREAVAAVMRRASAPVRTEATTAPDDGAKNWSRHAFGAVFVEARVDADLGRIRIPRVVGVYGVGNRLNEKTAHSQLLGGIVWGLSMALFEESRLDVRNGRFVNASLAEYHVPVNADIGDIDITFVNEDDPHVNPLGAKGIGEIGITGVAGAVANAVYNATGRRVRDLPITLDKVVGA